MQQYYFNLLTSLKIIEEIVQTCLHAILRLKILHFTTPTLNNGPWHTDVMPLIICVLQLKFEKAILLMRCSLPLLQGIQCGNSGKFQALVLTLKVGCGMAGQVPDTTEICPLVTRCNS